MVPCKLWLSDNSWLHPQGEAVRLIEEGKAPRIIQWEGGASYDQMWKAKELAKVRGPGCVGLGTRVCRAGDQGM